MSKRFTIEEVRSYLNTFNYELLSAEYAGSTSPLEVKCPIGHSITMTFNGFKNNNSRCKICANNVAYDIEFVRTYMAERNYVLLSTTYNNSKEKLLIRCPLGHEFPMTFDSFKNKGSECSICAEISRINKRRHSFEYIKQEIESNGYKLLTTTYDNAHQELETICPHGHSYFTTFDRFSSGKRCMECKIEYFMGENHPNWNGGITPEHNKIRNSPEGREWRLSVFGRDKFTCQACFKTGGDLRAHHINNFSTHEELRFDLDNGITLCINCHDHHIQGSFHCIYGTKNNTKEQLDEYIQLKKLTLTN